MEPSMGQVVPPFRRRFLGYDRSEVDQFLQSTIAECRHQLDEARKTDMIRAASGEIAALLRSFAESVAIMHDDAERKAGDTVSAAESKAAEAVTAAERKAAEAVTAAERKAAEAVSDAHAEAMRIRDEAVAAARAATEEAEARRTEGERVLREASVEATRVLDEARQQAAALMTTSRAELDSRVQAIAAQRMMTEQEVARAAEHLAGVLSALRSLDQLAAGSPDPARPATGAAVTGGQPEGPADPAEGTSPPAAVDLNEEHGFPAVLARWSDRS
jgi:cell division septum initiation protein DivIVA